ncbi:MAG: histidine phosphatase family protein [Acidimicrobiales bacterium]|nr:histidine phosphatase family protein [Acidimicrobiales bacterium]
MTRLVVVRHALPMAADGVIDEERPLAPEGRTAAGGLGARLGQRWATANVWTSPARRARETAALALPSVTARPRRQLREVERAWYPSPEELAPAAARYLRGQPVEGWEPWADVRARLAALRDDVEASEDLVVVTHGALLTIWLDDLVGLDDPPSFWADLRTPDAWELDLDRRTLERLA